MQDSNGSRTRRDFLTVMTGSFAAIGSAAAAWPVLAQMSPNPGTPSPSVLVDLTPIRPGQAITVSWRAQPIIIRHRTREEVRLARSVPLDGLLDPFARNASLPANAPASDANRTRAGRPEWLVVVGICPHLGCRLITNESVDPGKKDEAWFCPCHAARFDLAGRLVSGPATTNLAVPPYRFVAANRIEIGRL